MVAAVPGAEVTNSQIDRALLDEIESRLAGGASVAEALGDLADGLGELRRSAPDTWPGFVKDVALHHPLASLLARDPYTRRARAKPRGYAGDAYMMDYVYGRGEAMKELSDLDALGREIFRFTASTRPAPRTVRDRARILARAIDDTSETTRNASVLSVACGHVREALGSCAVRERRLGRFVALDQDARSLEVVARELGPSGVEPVRGKIRQLIAGEPVVEGSFDLIYSAGLYDYLEDPAARMLSRVLFERLKPGGRLLISNFVRDIPDAGYMEACMDWWLIHRSPNEMTRLVDDLPLGPIASIDRSYDDGENVVFLDVRRK